MAERPPCDLDPLTFIVAAAFWHPVSLRWMAPMHGKAVANVAVMDACGCLACVGGARLVRSWRQGPPAPPLPEPEPPKRVDVGPVRERVLELLASGWSRDEIATAAGVDRSTVCRLLRPYAARVSVDTAAAVLTLSV